APSVQRHAHASGLHAVATVLDDLHRDVLRSAGAESSQVRLSVLNVVAACNDSALVDGATQAVLAAAEHHPARAIVIFGSHEGEAMLESDVSLQRTESGTYVELVRLEVRGQAALHLASIVEPLLVPDIPVHLWLVGAPPLEQAFDADAVALVDRIILDTAAFNDVETTLQLVAQQVRQRGAALHLSDLAWARLHPWREAVAGSFDGPAVGRWVRHIRAVDIISGGERSAVESWLLAGWLASRLEWTPTTWPDLSITGTGRPNPHVSELERLRIVCEDGGHTAHVDVERRGALLHTSINVDAGMVASRAIALPRSSQAVLIAHLMAEVDEDGVYPDAIDHASRIVAGQR
ncbi:MAG: glucose-6-phosphate dehydrogenase assembly protein OpcA, partial [Candidatus Dormibacteria bacterium]